MAKAVARVARHWGKEVGGDDKYMTTLVGTREQRGRVGMALASCDPYYLPARRKLWIQQRAQPGRTKCPAYLAGIQTSPGCQLSRTPPSPCTPPSSREDLAGIGSHRTACRRCPPARLLRPPRSLRRGGSTEVERTIDAHTRTGLCWTGRRDVKGTIEVLCKQLPRVEGA